MMPPGVSQCPANSLCFFFIVALTPGKPRHYRSTLSIERQIHRETTVAELSLDRDSTPSAPATFPCGESSPGRNGDRFLQGLAMSGTGPLCSVPSRPWACSEVAIANQRRQAVHAEISRSPIDGTRRTEVRESPFRRVRASRSWREDDCRPLAVGRCRERGNSDSAGW